MRRKHPLQLELDRLADRHRWARSSFGSWRAKGYVLQLSSTDPRRLLAVRGARRREFKSAAELEVFVLGLPVR